MKFFFRLLCVASLLSASDVLAQNINPANIDIVRDSFGVPHIFAKTNAEAAYALAWVQCEDNFKVMQEFLAISKGFNGRLNGVSGAATDYIAQVFEMEKRIDERFEKDISPDFRQVLNAYCAGLNRYAEAHPEEVILKKLAPISVRDILKGYIFNFLLMNNSAMDIIKVFKNKMELYKTLGNMQGAGSNAMAYSPNKTTDGKTYLVANPHQPIEGPSSFYEVALYTDEGWNFHGVTFIGGGVSPVIGTNQNLGWTHTTNYDDYGDVYQLNMRKGHLNQYKFDGKWLKLKVKYAKLKVKLGKVVLAVTKKYYTSVHGPVFKNKTGYYAFRNNSYMHVGAPEQWYRMGLAKNYEEFWKALNMQQIPCQTITYADKAGNIFHLNNALMPKRTEGYQWRGILPGDTSATVWSLEDPMPVSSLVCVKNPRCGYVFNCNNSPFDMTAPEENPKPENYPASFGILKSNTLRANRYTAIIKNYPTLSFADAKTLRDDDSYEMSNLNFRQVMNLQEGFNLSIEKYPDLAEVMNRLRRWNGHCSVNDTTASLMAVFGAFISDYLGANFAAYENTFSEADFVRGLRESRDYLLKHYGTLDVPLGTVQKISRGGKELPMYGGIETLASTTVSRGADGKLRMNKGDTFIMYAKYGKDGLEELLTSNNCGNSSNPKSKHHNDQMEMFVKKQPKKITMNRDEIYKQAISITHPQ